MTQPYPVQPPRRVYLSGPMSGLPDLNFPAFHAAASSLREQGYDVVNPAELCVHLVEPSWEDCMRVDLAALLTCDAIAMLPNWHASRGAMIEWRLARDLGMPAFVVGP